MCGSPGQAQLSFFVTSSAWMEVDMPLLSKVTNIVCIPAPSRVLFRSVGLICTRTNWGTFAWFGQHRLLLDIIMVFDFKTMLANHTWNQISLLGNTPRKNWGIHIAAFLSRQPLVKGERLVRYEVNAVMLLTKSRQKNNNAKYVCLVLCRMYLENQLCTMICTFCVQKQCCLKGVWLVNYKTLLEMQLFCQHAFLNERKKPSEWFTLSSERAKKAFSVIYA